MAGCVGAKRIIFLRWTHSMWGIERQRRWYSSVNYQQLTLLFSQLVAHSKQLFCGEILRSLFGVLNDINMGFMSKHVKLPFLISICSFLCHFSFIPWPDLTPNHQSLFLSIYTYSSLLRRTSIHSSTIHSIPSSISSHYSELQIMRWGERKQ